MAAVRHIGFVWGIFGPPTVSTFGSLITVQNLVMIDVVVFIIYEHFNIGRVWLENAYSRPKNWGFWAI